MNLLYIADNGFSSHNGKYYCTAPNKTNIEQYKRYFDAVHVIARRSKYQDNSFELSSDSKVILVKKNRFLLLYKAMKELRHDYSVVLMRNGINGCFAGTYAAILKKVRIAYCGSDPYDFQHAQKSFFRKYIAAPVWGILERHKMAGADYSQYCTQYLYNRYPTKHPYLICSNVDIVTDQNDYAERLRKIGASSSEKMIGMIGRIDENKGVRTIIRALARLGNEYRFEMIGGGDPQAFREEIDRLGVSDRIEFLGYYSDKDKIKRWLKTVDIYVQPSLSEGLPRSTVEAMSMACPCIATNIAGLPDLLDKEYLIKPGDDAALAGKIRWLACNPEEAERAAGRSFEKSKEFRREVRDKKLGAFYGSIVNEDPGRDK